MNITWGEYKKYIESQGISDDHEVSYIDAECDHIPKVSICPDENSFYVHNGDSLEEIKDHETILKILREEPKNSEKYKAACSILYYEISFEIKEMIFTEGEINNYYKIVFGD